MKFRFTRSALIVLPALVLAACGGGGGGGGDGSSGNPSTPSQPAAPSATLAVTSSNAKPVAADALDASVNIGAAVSGTALVTGVQVDTVPASTSAPVTLSSLALQFARQAAQAPALATGAVIDEPLGCVSGTGTLKGSGSDSSLRAGDSVVISADNCTLSSGSKVSGTLRIDVTSGSLSDTAPAPQQVTLAVTSSGFSAYDGASGVTNVADGDLRMDINIPAQTNATITLSGTSLRNAWSGPGGSHSSTLKNYRIVQTVLSQTQTMSDVTATVVTTNPRIGTDVVYVVTTPVPLITDLSLVLKGQLKVTGAHSGLQITVTTINNFKIEIDANGDGTYESNTTSGLADLQYLL